VIAGQELVGGGQEAVLPGLHQPADQPGAGQQHERRAGLGPGGLRGELPSEPAGAHGGPAGLGRRRLTPQPLGDLCRPTPGDAHPHCTSASFVPEPKSIMKPPPRS